MLTKRLVKSGAAKRRLAGKSRAAGQRSRGAARTGGADGSRDRLFAAAAREFAARGFAGASVDRIAASARVNKAMIYYHFGSKAGLYREILRDMFQAVGAGVRGVVDLDVMPEAKIAPFIDAIAAAAEARPHFPPIWLREIAEGGRHLDADVLRDVADVLRGLAGILGDGVRSGRFRPVNPVLVHAMIVAPLLLFFASGDLRERLARAGIADAAQFNRELVVAHLRRVTLGVLEGRM